MTSDRAARVPAGRMAWGVVLAIVIGALTPLLTLLEVGMLLPVVMVGGVFAVFLKCYAGPLPAGLCVAAQLLMASWALGPTYALILLLAQVLPAAIMINNIDKKRPFFNQMRAALVWHGLGLLAALAVAYRAFGGGMIARLMASVRGEFERMPNETLEPMVEMVNSMLSGAGLTVEVYRAQFSGMLDLLQETYALNLPGTLLSGAALSAVLSVLWGNWTMARRGLATAESFVGLSGWYLPAQATLGLLAMWLVSYILASGGYASGQTVYVAAYMLLSLAFTLQALAAFDRRLLAASVRTRRRKWLIGVLLVVGQLFRLLGAALFIGGAASALFGSRGAMRQLARRRGGRSDGDDSDR